MVNLDLANTMRWLVFTRTLFLGEKFNFQIFQVKFSIENLTDKDIYIYIYIYIYIGGWGGEFFVTPTGKSISVSCFVYVIVSCVRSCAR